MNATLGLVRNLHPGDLFEPGPQVVSIYSLTPSPENAALYRHRTLEDADYKRLVESVRDSGGIRAEEPLLISRDGFIVSGHQRRNAADEAGFTNVPVIVLDVRHCEHTEDEWIAILRQYNIQREKTLDERIRENLVDINPADAMQAVIDDQVARAKPKSETVYIPSARRKRARITSQTRDFADAIINILTGVLKDVLPVNERAIHYRLLPPLNVRTSRGKRGFTYGNDVRSVKALSHMLTRLRVRTEVPWEWICDETRPVAVWETWENAAEYQREKVEEFLTDFARDLMRSQSAHYEIIAEKLTVKSFINPVGARYTIPVAILRGNSSIDARYQIVKRFVKSGKKYLILFVLTDCDPAGDSICETTVHSLRDEFGIDPDCVKAIRVAMTHVQADALHLPKALKVKESAVTPKFLKRHGRDDCYELEAVDPEVLAGWLDNEIRANIDVEAYNYEVEKQGEDVSYNEATRAAVIEVIKGVMS